MDTVTIQIMKVESHLWRFTALDESELAGWVAVSRNPNGRLEIGWGVRERHRGQGLATAAAADVLDWLAERHPGEPVIAVIRPDNLASLRVARKLGFRVTAQDPRNVYLMRGQDPPPTPGAGMSVVSLDPAPTEETP